MWSLLAILCLGETIIQIKVALKRLVNSTRKAFFSDWFSPKNLKEKLKVKWFFCEHDSKLYSNYIGLLTNWFFYYSFCCCIVKEDSFLKYLHS